MSSFLAIFNLLADLAFAVIVVQAIMSWLIAFDVINTYQPLVQRIWTALNALTEPVYRPIRRVVPNMGGIDLTPMVALLGIYALRVILNNNLG